MIVDDFLYTFGQTVMVFRYLSIFCCCVCCCGALQVFESPKTRNTITVWLARGAPEELWGLLGRLRHPCVSQTVMVFRFLSLFCCCVCCCGALQGFESPKTRNTITASLNRCVGRVAQHLLSGVVSSLISPSLRASKTASAGLAKRLQ